MKEILITQIVRPMLHRVGTVVGGILLANNIDATLAAQIEAGLIALGLVALDIYFDKKGSK